MLFTPKSDHKYSMVSLHTLFSNKIERKLLNSEQILIVVASHAPTSVLAEVETIGLGLTLVLVALNNWEKPGLFPLKKTTAHIMPFSDLKPVTARYVYQIWQKEWDKTILVCNKFHKIRPKLLDNLKL